MRRLTERTVGESMIGERGRGGPATRYTLKAVGDEAEWIQKMFMGYMTRLEDYVDSLEGDDAMVVEAEAKQVDDAVIALNSALRKLADKARRGPVWKG